MILNKIDLLPYVPFSVDRCLTMPARSIRTSASSRCRPSAAMAWKSGTTGFADVPPSRPNSQHRPLPSSDTDRRRFRRASAWPRRIDPRIGHDAE